MCADIRAQGAVVSELQSELAARTEDGVVLQRELQALRYTLRECESRSAGALEAEQREKERWVECSGNKRDFME